MVEKNLFVADLHARPEETHRQKMFKQFLAKEALTSKSLYLLGDIFEFGFVFRGRILPCYQPLIEDLESLVAAGVDVNFLGGNHDVWMSDYLLGKGLCILHDGEVVNLVGHRIQLFHGFLIQPDPLSRFVERIMNNPDAVWLYSQTPPALGFRLALKAAMISRTRHRSFPRSVRSSRLKVIDPDVDMVISGHHHDPVEFKYHDRLFCSVGNFFADFTYVELTGQGLKRRTFSD